MQLFYCEGVELRHSASSQCGQFISCVPNYGRDNESVDGVAIPLRLTVKEIRNNA